MQPLRSLCLSSCECSYVIDVVPARKTNPSLIFMWSYYNLDNNCCFWICRRRQCKPGVEEKLLSPNLLWSFDVAFVIYNSLPDIHLHRPINLTSVPSPWSCYRICTPWLPASTQFNSALPRPHLNPSGRPSSSTSSTLPCLALILWWALPPWSWLRTMLLWRCSPLPVFWLKRQVVCWPQDLLQSLLHPLPLVTTILPPWWASAQPTWLTSVQPP